MALACDYETAQRVGAERAAVICGAGGAVVVAEQAGGWVDGEGEEVAVQLIEGIRGGGVWSQVDVEGAEGGIGGGTDRSGDELDERAGNGDERLIDGVDLEGFDAAFSGVEACGVDDREVGAGGFSGEEGGAVGEGRGERGAGDFGVGAGGGVDLIHVDAVVAGGEEEAGFGVDDDWEAEDLERRSGRDGEGAGGVAAGGDSAAGGVDERLLELGVGGGGEEKCGEGEDDGARIRMRRGREWWEGVQGSPQFSGARFGGARSVDGGRVGVNCDYVNGILLISIDSKRKYVGASASARRRIKQQVPHRRKAAVGMTTLVLLRWLAGKPVRFYRILILGWGILR